jgi:hypothetical protein
MAPFGPPLPGYDAHAERLVSALRRSMTALIGVLRDLPTDDRPRPPRALSRQINDWARRHGLDADPAVGLRAVAVWARLHGLISLEISGNFTSMGLDAEQLFESELRALSSR